MLQQIVKNLDESTQLSTALFKKLSSVLLQLPVFMQLVKVRLHYERCNWFLVKVT